MSKAKASKQSARARSRHANSDYPRYFLDGLREKAKNYGEVPPGQKFFFMTKGVYIRVHDYLGRDRYYLFADEERAKQAVDHAILGSS